MVPRIIFYHFWSLKQNLIGPKSKKSYDGKYESRAVLSSTHRPSNVPWACLNRVHTHLIMASCEFSSQGQQSNRLSRVFVHFWCLSIMDLYITWKGKPLYGYCWRKIHSPSTSESIISRRSWFHYNPHNPQPSFVDFVWTGIGIHFTS